MLKEQELKELKTMVNLGCDFFVNANNDPAGTTLDNDPLNQVRTSNPNAIYYLNPGYAMGLRAGRITRLIEDELAGDGEISFEDMQNFQANTQQLDAEILTPFLLAAWESAMRPGAPDELAGFSSDPVLSEAIGRLTTWDFSTPTGIPEGYDAIIRACEALGAEGKPAEHIAGYGLGSEERLTGAHETQRFDQFSYGVSDRGASIRIPWQVHLDQKGYIEDRRPNANMDPYVVTRLITNTCCEALAD